MGAFEDEVVIEALRGRVYVSNRYRYNLRARFVNAFDTLYVTKSDFTKHIEVLGGVITQYSPLVKS